MSAGGASKRKARRKRTEERVVVQYEVRYLLSDRDKAPMPHAAVQQLKGEPQQVQALLSKITPEDLGTALHTFDHTVEQFADMEDAAGGCLCFATPMPTIDQHPIWKELAMYNNYYASSGVKFEAIPADDPQVIVLSGKAAIDPRRVRSGSEHSISSVRSDASNGVLAAQASDDVGAGTGLVGAAPAEEADAAAAWAAVDEAQPAAASPAPVATTASQPASAAAPSQPSPPPAAQARRAQSPNSTDPSGQEGQDQAGSQHSEGSGSGADAPAEAVAAPQADEGGTGSDGAEVKAEPEALGPAVANAADMTEEERQAAWKAASKARLEAEAEAKAAARQAMLDAMEDDEREAFLAEEATKAANAAKQERVLKRQLKAYRSKKSNPLKSRGRGRGRGKGKR